MKNKMTLGRRLMTKFAALTAIMSLVLQMPLTYSFYSDTEESTDNLLASGSVDLEIASSGFLDEPILPGDVATGSATFSNVGSHDFEYDQEYKNLLSNELCGVLNIKVYDGILLVFDGLLTDLAYTAPDLLLNTQSNDYSYEISLPDGTPDEFADLTCSFSVESHAYQPELGVPQVGFWDVEEFEVVVKSGTWTDCRNITGKKINADTKEGISDWEIIIHPVGGETFDEFDLNANDVDGELTEVLESGKTYLIEVEGTWRDKSASTEFERHVDADYYTHDAWSTHDDFDENAGRDKRELDVVIDEQDIDWGGYNSDHLYKTTVKGDDAAVNIRIFEEPNDSAPDPNIVYEDNTGSLSVRVYDVTDEIVKTGEDGTYEAEVCGGEYQIVEVAKDGWEQVSPREPNYYHINVNDLTGEEKFDFENKWVANIVINEVYYDVDGTHGADGGTQTDEWIELYNPNPFPVNLKKWSLTDNTTTRTVSNRNVYIPAFGYAVLSKAAQTWGYWSIPSDAITIELGQGFGTGLNNTGDRMILKNADGVEIDAVSWGDDTYAFTPSVVDVAEGHSISRKVKGVDTNTADDWMDTHAGSTPSGPNPGTNPHNSLGELVMLTTVEVASTSAQMTENAPLSFEQVVTSETPTPTEAPVAEPEVLTPTPTMTESVDPTPTIQEEAKPEEIVIPEEVVVEEVPSE